MGQTTAFRKEFIKSDVLIMGETTSLMSSIHTWSMEKEHGHFMEDMIKITSTSRRPPTDLNLHPNSPGYLFKQYLVSCS